MYCGDGDFTTAGGYKALSPAAAVQGVANEIGPGFGRWAAKSAEGFRLTFYCVICKAGLVNGFERVRKTLILSESGKSIRTGSVGLFRYELERRFQRYQ
jgi:hypothetical protein